MKTPINYYGGKQNMLKHILPIIPHHRLYVEPFFGGGAVFWAKPPSKSECVNDLNENLITFYRQLKTNFNELKSMVDGSLYCRTDYDRALYIYSGKISDNIPHSWKDGLNDKFEIKPIDKAWAVWYLSCVCFSSIIGNSFGYERKSNQQILKINNRKLNFNNHLSIRLENVCIENRDALYIISSRDNQSSSDDTFFYCDPPYIETDQGHYKGYTNDDYIKLLNTLANIKGKFLLSSYPNKLLDDAIKANHWEYILVKTRCTSCIQTRTDIDRERTEVLVYNYDLNTTSKAGFGF